MRSSRGVPFVLALRSSIALVIAASSRVAAAPTSSLGDAHSAPRVESAHERPSLRVERDEDGSAWIVPERVESSSAAVRSEVELLERADDRARESSALLGVDWTSLERVRVQWLPLGLIGSTDKLAVRYRQTRAGIPVEGAMCVLLDTRGRLLACVSTAAAANELDVPPARVEAREAVRIALGEFEDRTGEPGVAVGAPTLLFARDAAHPERGHELVWTLTVRTATVGTEPEIFEVRVAAHGGLVVQFFDKVMRYDVTGRVGGWINPGLLPDDLGHGPIGQTTCSPCATTTCGACPPTACAVPASGPDPSAEIPVTFADLELVDPFGNVAYSEADGSFRLPGSAPLTVTVRFRGRFATVVNDAGANYALTTTLLHDAGNRIMMGGPAPYAGDQVLTAQANAYGWATRMRQWIAEVNPTDTTWEQDPFLKKMRVNLAQTVNGCDGRFLPPGALGVGSSPETWFSIGGGICGQFPPPAVGCGCCGAFDGTCTNKANATVLVHELGHWMNWRYLDLPNPSAFHEGLADVWAMFISNQPELFPFYCSAGTCVRSGENCRQYTTYSDQFLGDPHKKGEVIMGALWKVRARLVAVHGVAAGESTANALFLAWISAYPEFAIHPGIKRRWLVLDDDDANVLTPTPHQAAILSGFQSHGL